MLGTIFKIAGAVALGAVGYVAYKRYFGTTEGLSCDGATPWYAPEPLYDCGQQTANGAIDGRQYQNGQWIYHFANGHMAKESAMHATSKAGAALSGAPVAIL